MPNLPSQGSTEDEKENIYSSAESVESDEVSSVIVVEDHVTKDNFLPRTKLVKSLSQGEQKAQPKKECQTWNPTIRAKEARYQKDEGGTVRCGPWYDLWGMDASVKG